MTRSNKRRKLPIVDRRFQLKYTSIIIAVALAVSTVLGGFLWSAYNEMNEILSLTAVFSADVTDRINADDSRFVFLLSAVMLVAEVVVLGVLGIVVTHRVVGPVFVMHRHLDTLRGGRFPTIRPLREGDEFGDAFETLRALIVDLRQRDASDLDRLEDVLHAARASGTTETAIAQLERMIDDRRQRLHPDSQVS